MATQHGVVDFLFQTSTKAREEEYKDVQLFGPDKIKKRIVNYVEIEGNVSIFRRIDEFIAQRDASIINIESIYKYAIWTGGEPRQETISNRDIKGYRVFYRLKK